jgi:short-subunit dehydrogenase
MSIQVAGSRVLVTGATGGLGHAIARTFAARGAHLVVSGRRADELEGLAAEIRGQAVIADLSKRDDVARLLAEAGEVDIFVANAAVPGSGPVLEYTPEQIDRALDVNLRAPIQMSRILAEEMIGRGRGHIVLVGSLAGLAATPGSGIYSATKFGLRGFAHGFGQDLDGTGVGVSMVMPGFVRDAGMFAESGAKLPWMVRTVSPRQVADAIIAAIEHNRLEVSVAPAELKGGAFIGTLIPNVAVRVQRRFGTDKTARQLANGQRAKR